MSRPWQRHLWFRGLTALFGVWFVLATSEVTSLHACPMHDGPAAGMSDDGHDASMSMVDMSMADMSMAGIEMPSHAGHTMPADHSGSPTNHHNCTCISTCCAATASPLVASAEILHITARYTLVAPDIAAAAHTPRVRWIDFVLPFANAPPVITNA